MADKKKTYEEVQAEGEAWRKKMSECTDKATLEYLLRTKPKGVKGPITSGTPVVVHDAADGLPFLDKLCHGKGKELPSIADQMKGA